MFWLIRKTVQFSVKTLAKKSFTCQFFTMLHSAQNCSHTMLLSIALYKSIIFLIYRQIPHMFRLIYRVGNSALPSNEQNGSKIKSIAEKKVKVLAAPWGSLDSYLVYVKHFWGHAYYFVFTFFQKCIPKYVWKRQSLNLFYNLDLARDNLFETVCKMKDNCFGHLKSTC